MSVEGYSVHHLLFRGRRHVHCTGSQLGTGAWYFRRHVQSPPLSPKKSLQYPHVPSKKCVCVVCIFSCNYFLPNSPLAFALTSNRDTKHTNLLPCI